MYISYPSKLWLLEILLLLHVEFDAYALGYEVAHCTTTTNKVRLSRPRSLDVTSTARTRRSPESDKSTMVGVTSKIPLITTCCSIVARNSQNLRSIPESEDASERKINEMAISTRQHPLLHQILETKSELI